MRYIIPFITLSKILKSLYILFLLEILLIFCDCIVTKQIFNGFLFISPVISYLKIIFLFLCICILKSNLFYIYLNKLDLKDFYFFFGFLILFLLFFLHINDFFLLFFNFEIISILLYIIIIYQKKFSFFYFADLSLQLNLTKYQQLLMQTRQKLNFSLLSIRAGIIYFLFNAFFSGLFLFGLTLVFFFFNQSNFLIIFFRLQYYLDFGNSYFLTVFMFFSLISIFFFKLAIVPFHWWLSAVFEGTSILILFFISIPLKFIFFFMFFKLLIFFFSFYSIWLQQIFLICGLFSLIYGSFGLFQQTKLKKFRAFSTINHMGYLLLALMSLTFLGFRSFLIYFVFYININFLFFLILQGLFNESLTHHFLYQNSFKFLTFYRNYFLGFLLLLVFFSLIGIPPLLGFWGKYLILCAVYQFTSFKIFIFIFFIVICTTLIAASSYLQLWKSFYVSYSPDIFKKNILIPFPLFNIYLMLFSSFLLIFSFLVFFYEDFFFFLDNFIFLFFFDY
jgi:NADH-quinone oxidoreductase subunit N